MQMLSPTNLSLFTVANSQYCDDDIKFLISIYCHMCAHDITNDQIVIMFCSGEY